MKCPLCDDEVDRFHKRSHLLPEWMYKDCYSNKHKLINLYVKKKIVIKRQKGLYDEIICSKCEIESQRYDHYASLVLTERSATSPEYLSVDRKIYEDFTHGRANIFSQWKNVNFQKLQKFFFACILRTHISEKKKGKYLLIDRHFSKIRKLYNSKIIVDDMSYPILIAKYLDKDARKNIITFPYIKKVSGHHLVEFAGAGFFFWIYVSNHYKPDYVYSSRLQQNGSISVIHEYVENCGTFKGIIPTIIDLAHRTKK